MNGSVCSGICRGFGIGRRFVFNTFYDTFYEIPFFSVELDSAFVEILL